MKFGPFRLDFSKRDMGNMSYHYGDKKEVKKNRDVWLKSLGVSKFPIIECEQSHSSKILVIKDKSDLKKHNLYKADACLSSLSHIAFMLKFGDCLPIYIYDKNKGAFALIHAGRRGLEKSIHLQAISLFQKHFASRKKDLFIYIGPHIKKCCYLYQSFSDLSNQKWKKYLSPKNGLLSCDLSTFVLDTLQSEGLDCRNISLSKHCTACSGIFYSHYMVQKNKQKEARFAALAYKVA